MSKQETDWKVQGPEPPEGFYPWVPLEEEKRGLILFRLRLPDGFNLVSRLYKPDFHGSDFLEGRVDTWCGLEWGEDFDVRQKLPKSSESCLSGKVTK
jgi:hypothetical protein